MCRSKDKGGRRCPAHTNPEQIAAYNAIRRERYHANKNTLASPTLIQVATKPLTVETVDVDPDNPFLFHKKFTGELDLEAVKDQQDPFGFEEYMNHYEELKKPYMEKGFNPSDWYSDLYQLSEDTIALASNEEIYALDLYTGGPTSAIHQYITTSQNAEEVAKKGGYSNKSEDFIEPDTLEGIYYEYDENNIANFTDNMYNKVIDHLDRLLEAGAVNQQRVVYRGLPPVNHLLPSLEYGNKVWEQIEKTKSDPKKLRAFKNKLVEENIQIGQEVVFDSYLSTTLTPHVAADFATMGMLEILTPKGAHIEAESQYADEHEVLLPRGSRYKIVGVRYVDTITTENGKNHDFNGQLPIIQMVAINSKGEILDGTNDDPLPPLPGGKK